MDKVTVASVYMRKQEEDFIKLHKCTGAIKGSSVLLGSFDLYHGIHNKKRDAYFEYRARPGSYENAVSFPLYIPDGWSQ